MIPHSARSAGFTLIELLVSLVLVALLTTVLLAGLRLVTQPVDRQADRLALSAKTSVVFGFVEARLADARPIVPVNGDTDAVAFDGGTGGVTFVGPAPQGAVGDGLYLYSLVASGDELRARWRRFDGLFSGSGEASDGSILLHGIRKAEFAYYGAATADTAVAWGDRWRDAAYLPLLVRLRLIMKTGERLPELVVAPRPQPLRAIPQAAAAAPMLQ
ncbi:MAG TPA: prepilin-type N-terminal cleavage/methylation domain-containing protein [Stellaceae bacterium]|nr:prepilin-type N-terminal cleavage/methylation domain-containing protein [Stellaceae bacterium]